MPRTLFSAIVSGQTYANGSTSSLSYVVNSTTNMVTQATYTDERGTQRRMTFDAGGRISENIYGFGSALAQTSTAVRGANNLMTSMTDSLNRRTDYTYNAKGQVLTTTRLAGTANAVTTTYTYGTAYNLVTSIKDPNNNATTLGYDSLGRLTTITDANSNATTMTYDAQGRVLTSKNALNHTTTYAYEGPDIKTVTDPLSRVTTMFTDAVGRVLSVKDPLGNITQTEYDNLNRVTKVTDAINGNVAFTYDAMGNMLTHADQKGNVTTYTYNLMNKLATKKDALNQTDTYAYDAATSLNRVIDRKSQVSGMTYDVLGRRTQVGFGATTANPTTYANKLDFTFDAANRMTQVIDNISGSNQTITRNYDNLNRLTSEVTPQGTVSYTYDAAGRRTSMTVPSHGTIAYIYDSANRLTLMTHTPQAPAVGSAQTVGFTYDTANRRTKVTLPNTLEINYAY
ncbi:MAG: RHS repeat-associated core domain-containing protein, partial [Casimicrobium sp.]